MKLIDQRDYQRLSQELSITEDFDQFILTLGKAAIRLGFVGLCLNVAVGYALIRFADLTYKTRFDGTLLWLFTIPIHSDYSWFVVWFGFCVGFIPSLILLRSGLSLRLYWKTQSSQKLEEGIRTLKYNLLYNLVCNALIVMGIVLFSINYLVFLL
ncbi:hypothetical protein [Spirosoma litoris]